jgi:hypothetical protein
VAHLDSERPEKRAGGAGPEGAPKGPNTPQAPRAHSPANFDELSIPRLGVAAKSKAASVNNDPKTDSREPIFRPSLLLTALRESTATLSSLLDAGITRLEISPAVVRFGQVALGSTLCLSMFLDTSGTLGMAGTAMILGAAAFKKYDHARAQNILGNIALTAHTALIGDILSTISNAVGCIRNVAQAMIPDAHLSARTASALIGAGMGVGMFSISTDIFPLMKVDNIPAVATTLFSVAGALPKAYNWLSRTMGLVGCASFIPYYLTRLEMSTPSLVLSFGMSAILLGNIVKNDLLPRLRASKKTTQTA